MENKKKYVVISDLLDAKNTISGPYDISEIMEERTDEALEAIINGINEFDLDKRSSGLAVLVSKCGIICPVETGIEIVKACETIIASEGEKLSDARKKYETIINSTELESVRYVPLTLNFYYSPNYERFINNKDVLFNGIVDFDKLCAKLNDLGCDITMTNNGIYFNKENNYEENFVNSYDDFLQNGIRKYNGTEGIKIRLNPSFKKIFESVVQDKKNKSK